MYFYFLQFFFLAAAIGPENTACCLLALNGQKCCSYFPQNHDDAPKPKSTNRRTERERRAREWVLSIAAATAKYIRIHIHTLTLARTHTLTRTHRINFFSHPIWICYRIFTDSPILFGRTNCNPQRVVRVIFYAAANPSRPSCSKVAVQMSRYKSLTVSTKHHSLAKDRTNSERVRVSYTRESTQSESKSVAGARQEHKWQQ